MKFTTLLAAAALSLSASMALAETTEKMATMTDPGLKSLMAPMDAMMAAMPMTSTGNPDADFLLMMIPHHQAAIGMAEVELKTGKDDATKAMAQKIIDAQKGEIAQMGTMLKGMGITPPVAQ